MLVVSTFFVLSLLAAFVLFKWFKSTAVIANKTYQVGGAIAGFIIIFLMLFESYVLVEESKCHKILTHYNQLTKALEEKEIKGVLIPPPGEKPVQVILGTKYLPDSRGTFKFIGRWDPEKDNIAIYVQTEDNKFVHRNITSEEEMKGYISIPVKY